jgi:hypothetical protein
MAMRPDAAEDLARVRDERDALAAQLTKARDELRNIATVSNDKFQDADEFRVWARNRARHVLALAPDPPVVCDVCHRGTMERHGRNLWCPVCSEMRGPDAPQGSLTGEMAVREYGAKEGVE